MSILDRATNDALNAIIDLHARRNEGGETTCSHCTDLTKSDDGWVLISFPCPTITAMLGACQPIMAARKGN